MSRWHYIKGAAAVLSLNRVARLNTDGTLDSSWNTGSGADNSVQQCAIQSDGKVVIGGLFTHYNGTAINRIARINTDGTIDTEFTPGTGANNYITSVAIQSDGKILISGVFTSYNGIARTRLARLNTDGTLDTGFSVGTGLNNSASSIYPLSSGKILIVGPFTTYNDTSRNYIVQVNSDGSLDTGFDPGAGANAVIYAAGVQSDGKFVVVGNFTSYDGTSLNRIARVNSDGTIDTGYTVGTGANQTIYAIDIQGDGKAVIGGRVYQYNGVTRTQAARINTDGTLDTSYDPGAGTQFGYVITVRAQSDGKLVLGGNFTLFAGIAQARMGRTNADGTNDSGFTQTTGPNAQVQQVQVQSDGKIIIVGGFTGYSG